MMALIKTWFEDFFNIQRGDPLDLQKRFLQCGVRGGNFARKKIQQNQKFLKYVQGCPVKCLWLKFKISQLSPTPNNRSKWKQHHAIRLVFYKVFYVYDFWEYLPSLQLCYMAAQGPTRSQWKHIINILDNTSYILYHKQLDLKTYRRGRVGSGGSVCPAVTVSGIKAEARVLSFPSGLVSWKIVENWGMLGIITDSAVKRSIGSTTGCTITEKAPTMTFVSRTQFHIERPWGQCPFSIVS